MYRMHVAKFLLPFLLLSGCGGGDGDDGGSTTPPPPPPPEPTNAGGIWAGTATVDNVAGNIAGVITEEGAGRFVDADGTQYILGDVSGDDGSLSADFTAIAGAGLSFSDGSTVTTGTLEATVTERDSLAGTYTLATGETGEVSMTYDEIYERSASLDKLTGNWDEEFGVMSFDPDGTFFEQDSFGCVFEGQASVVNPDFNAYELVMTVSFCGDMDGDYSGLGTLADTDAVDDTFILQMNKDELAFTSTLRRL